MRKAAFLFVLLAAAVVLVRPVFAADEVLDRTFPLSPGGSFELQNVNGSVIIAAWDRNEVELHAVKSARRNDADLGRVNIEIEARPDHVTVVTRYPHDDGVDVSVEYRVHVPARALLGHISTVNGTVRVSGVEGSGDLHSVNGDVEALDSAGHFDAHTTNGNVRLELRHLDGRGAIVADTVNGSVYLALPADAGADLEVHTLNGDLRSEFPMTMQGSLGPRDFHARLGSGGVPIRVRTVNGSVRVVNLRPTV